MTVVRRVDFVKHRLPRCGDAHGRQGLGKVGGGGLMSGVVGVLARVRRGPAGTMGGV